MIKRKYKFFLLSIITLLFIIVNIMYVDYMVYFTKIFFPTNNIEWIMEFCIILTSFIFSWLLYSSFLAISLERTSKILRNANKKVFLAMLVILIIAMTFILAFTIRNLVKSINNYNDIVNRIPLEQVSILKYNMARTVWFNVSYCLFNVLTFCSLIIPFIHRFNKDQKKLQQSTTAITSINNSIVSK